MEQLCAHHIRMRHAVKNNTTRMQIILGEYRKKTRKLHDIADVIHDALIGTCHWSFIFKCTEINVYFPRRRPVTLTRFRAAQSHEGKKGDKEKFEFKKEDN
ncbi:hypothetical protein KIN20_003208 [Parelaphostrongylus tenuis]|uniref:Uncharacterized protein n=1 Tax=Parelaphostrongylus tenuis TaxID=148309 RepID=A0AAD5LWY5_PARTN|nr:hypothetical protein KIN20_003208 [Parelaphostrongylus tenuis]